MGLEMTTGMIRRDKGQGRVRTSWGPGFLKKQLEAFTDGEGGRQRERERKAGVGEAMSKIQRFWQKLRGHPADVLGSCGRREVMLRTEN